MEQLYEAGLKESLHKNVNRLDSCHSNKVLYKSFSEIVDDPLVLRAKSSEL